MSWLADLLSTPQQPKTDMIELANSSAPATREHVVIEPMYPRLFSSDALSADELERHLEATGDTKLQGLALRVAAARSRLNDLTAAAEALSMAVDGAAYIGCTAEEWLQRELAEVQAQIEQAEAGRKRAEARRVARSARITPLHSAASTLHSKLLAERERLWDIHHSIKKQLGTVEDGQYEKLLAAGLTREQIASVGGFSAPDDRRNAELQRIQARLDEIEPQIAALDAWMASGKRAHQHLAGMGFDALIEAAKPVGEVAP